MFGRFFRQIRQQPKHIRDQYALWTAVVFTTVVAAVWLTGLPERFAADSLSVGGAASTSDPVFSSFMSELGGGLSGISEAITNLNQPATSTVATTSVPASFDTGTTSVGMTMTASTSSDTSVAPSPVRSIRIATTTASTAP